MKFHGACDRSPWRASACSKPRPREHRRCQAYGIEVPSRLPARRQCFLAFDRVHLRPLAWGIRAVPVLPGAQARYGFLCRHWSAEPVAQRAVSATRCVLLPALVTRQCRVRPSLCTSDGGVLLLHAVTRRFREPGCTLCRTTSMCTGEDNRIALMPLLR